MEKSRIFIQRTIRFSFLLLLLCASSLTTQAAGEIDPTFNAAVQYTTGANIVKRVEVQNDGKILIAGSFTVANNSGRSGLARLNANGSVDQTFVPPDFFKASQSPPGTFSLVEASINAIEVQADGKILVGGEFDRIGIYESKSGIVRLNSDGSLDNTFNAVFALNSNATSPVVSDIIIRSDGKVLISGNFTAGSGETRTNLARLNSDGSLDTTFNAGTSGITGNLVLLPDGKILYPAGTTVRRILSDGPLDGTFNLPSANGGISKVLVQSDGKILIGGGFTTVNGISKGRLARLNSDGTYDSTFNPGGNGIIDGNAFINEIEILPDGKLLVSGFFSTYNGAVRSNKVRLNNDGTIDNSATFTSPAFTIYDIKSLGDGRYITGGYDFGGGIGNLARFTADGSLDPTFSAMVYRKGSVRSVAAQSDGKVLIAGGFNRVNQIARAGYARLNNDGSVDESFVIETSGVNRIAVQTDGKIIFTGSFPQANGFSANTIRRFNRDGSIDSTFLPPAISGIATITLLNDGKILIGGDFTIAPSTVRYAVARLNADGSVDSTFSKSIITAGVGNLIRAIEVQADGKLLIGGSFNEINGISRNYIARLNADGTLDTGFSPTGANSAVADIAIQSDGSIIISGYFSVVNGINNQYYIARLSANGALDTNFVHSPNGYIFTVQRQSDNKLLVGGNFTFVNGVPIFGFARLNPDGTLDTSFSGNGSNDVVNDIKLQNDGKILVGGDYSRINNSSNVGVARILNNTAPRRAAYDFDGDGRSDVAVFRPSSGYWFTSQNPAVNYGAVQFGQQGDRLVPADYDGDGRTDFAVFRNGTWYIQRSALGFTSTQFGAADDVLVPADYDGDGRADIAVFRPSNGTWYLLQSQSGFAAIALGLGTDKPVPGDYNGDGRAEVAVFRPSNGFWYTSTNPAIGYGGVQFGAAEDKPVPADYDGDGKTDLAVFRPSNGAWYLLQSTAGFAGITFGLGTDAPTPADYDGDGKTDLAVFRPSNGTWYLNRTTSGFTGIAFGTASDLPVPNAFVR